MENNKQKNLTEDTIDFDDEYCDDEEDNDQTQKEESPPKNNQINQENSIKSRLKQEEQKVNNNTEEENNNFETKVKELNELNTNENKREIIDILMDSDLITKRPIKTAEYIKEKNKTKFSYVKSNVISHTSSFLDTQNNKKTHVNTYGRTGFQIITQEGDPELIEDMNVAANKLKNQIFEENEKVGKLLFDDNNKKSIKKTLTRKEIGNKIKKTLDKKKEKLQKIEGEMYDKEKLETTFTPVINHRKKDGGRRDLNTFLKFQKEYQNKIKQKKKDIYYKKQIEIKELNPQKPKLNKNSEHIARRKSSGEPIYVRLYNLRNESEEIIKQVEEKIKKEEELKKINTNKLYGYKTNKEKNQSFKSKKLRKGKSAENIKANNCLDEVNKKNNFDYKDIQLNKVLYNKFIPNFEESIIILTEEIKINNKNNLEELNESQYYNLLNILGMVTNPIEKNEKSAKNETKVEKSLNSRIKLLMKESFDLLRIQGKKIKIIDIKNFLICVLGLQNYNLYHIFISTHEDQEIKKLFPQNKYKNEDIPALILNQQNDELISQIDQNNKKNNKYISISYDNQIIFTLEKAISINRHFNKFAVNYRSKKNKIKERRLMNFVKKECPFKPEIGEKSNQLYQKYKDKILSYQNETLNSISTSGIKKPNNIEYMDRLLLLNKKRIAENQKIKEEMEQKQINECTFRPKISNYFTNIEKRKKGLNRNTIETGEILKVINNKQVNKNKNIFDELYEEGIKKLKMKKNKTKEEIDLETQKNDLTFQPKINSLDPRKIPKTYFKNDIYNEKEYKYLYERLKHGRLERLAKKSCKTRTQINHDIKQFIKDNKEYNYLENNQYYETDDPFYYNSSEINNIKNQYYKRCETYTKKMINNNNNHINRSQEIKNTHCNKTINENNSIDDDNNIELNKSQHLNEKIKIDNNNNKEPENNIIEIINETNNKEKIPLLIIDVNLDKGIKKKIFVHEGDTPEDLAQKFANENQLAPETKNKLQNLLHNHMARLTPKNTFNSQKYQNNDPIIK